MHFANSIMLGGLAVALIPVLLHLLTQHRAKRMQWGAMQFLMASVVRRNRKMLIEQILLLIVRCLALALIALAMALPFIPPESSIPWPIVLPTVLLGIAALGAGAALGAYRIWRWGLFAAGVLLIAGAIGVTVVEQSSKSQLIASAGGSDIAIVIDGSTSMQLAVDDTTNFDRALQNAAAVVQTLERGDAVSIIVAGGKPRAAIASPVAHSEQLSETLAKLKPIGGTMNIVPALEAAAATLKRGSNTDKKIVLITDGQSVGWKSASDVNWELLHSTLDDFAQTPAVLVNQLAMPERITNLQVVEVQLPDMIAVPDREIPINVVVKNTGGETLVKPVEVELLIDDQKDADKQDGEQDVLRNSVRDVKPGATETVTFRHRFAGSGLHSVTARIALADDLPWDNRAERIVSVFEQLPVLLVNGNATPRWQDRATSFLEVALTPDDDVPALSKKAGTFVSPTIVDAIQLSTVQNFNEYRAVVLADVAKLPANVALELSRYVADGGALVVAPGGRSDPEFYNAWRATDGRSLMPARLEGRRVATADGAEAQPDTNTFDHPSLKIIAANADTDFGTAALTAYWGLRADADDSVQVCGLLKTGEPLLVERKLGKGRVLLTAMSLDNRGSNLPALQSYLPFVQEMIGYAMQLPVHGLEFDAKGTSSVVLPLDSGHGIAQDDEPLEDTGLRAEYFTGADFAHRSIARVDPNIAFNWGMAPLAEGLPPGGTSARWSGTLTPATGGTYRFYVDGPQTKVWINGELAASTTAAAAAPDAPPSEPPANTPLDIDLVAGQPYAIRVEYVASETDRKCHLLWESTASPRGPISNELLSPQAAWKVQLAKSSQTEPTQGAVLVAPDGTHRDVTLAKQGNEIHANFSRLTEPGLYRLELPGTLRDAFRKVLVDAALPLVVESSPAESQLDVLTDDQLAAGSEHLPITNYASAADLVLAISGKTPGYRFWKLLVIAALCLLVAEIALSRWIAVQRRVGITPDTTDTPIYTPSLTRPAGKPKQTAASRATVG